jgi:CheY-like chemotaxis protein
MDRTSGDKPQAAQEPAKNPAPGSSVLFLCEDSEDDEFWFRKTFQKAGLAAAIFVVPTVRQALAFLQGCCDTSENIPRLVVLDFRLTDGKCTEVLEFIRQQEKLKHTPVITYSGGLNKEDLESTAKYGVVACLEKPLTVEKVEKFRQYLD